MSTYSSLPLASENSSQSGAGARELAWARYGANLRGATLWLCLGLFLTVWTPLRAADEPLVVETTVMKVATNAEGQTTLVDAATAAPGDVLVYRATYRNTGATTLSELIATLPVPPGLVYVEGSAVPAAVAATRDGKTYFNLATEPKPEPISAWRALRWAPRDLSAGGEFTIELSAQVAAPATKS